MATSATDRRRGIGAKAFQAALAPAVSLMNRLKYTQKFALVSLLFLFPMGMLILTLSTMSTERVKFSGRERQGIVYLRELRAIFPLLWQARVLAKASARGEVSARPGLVRAHSAIDKAFKSLAHCQTRLEGSLGTADDFAVLWQNWSELRNDGRRYSETDTDSRYAAILTDLRTLFATVGDNSTLILDPQIESYYLTDLILNKLPEGIENVDRASRLSTDREASPGSFDQRSSLAALLEATAQEIERSVSVATRAASSDSLGRALQSPLREYMDAIRALCHELVTPDPPKDPRGPRVDPSRISQAIQRSGDLWDAAVGELDLILKRRIDQHWRRVRDVAIGILLSLALVAYVWAGFYFAVMGTVSTLAEVSSRMVGGDMTVGAVLESRDEMGIVVRSFNDMAGRLRREWEQAREESVRAREAERRLRDSEERSRAILDSSMDAVAVLDGEGLILNWNPQAEVTFGWSSEEALGRSLAELAFPPATGEVFRKILASTLLEVGQHVPGIRSELTMTRDDGREVPIELTVTPVCASGKPAVGVFFRDLTDRRRAEEEAQRAETLRINKETAEAASRAKSEFLANMSHEIRTPMNGIIGMTELTLDTDLTLTQREYLSMVKSSADALLTVINDVLDFSKIEAGKVELESTDFDVHEVLGDTLKPLAVRSHAKGLELACRIAQNVPRFVRGDYHRLQQILINLVGNAIKFTEKGEVVVSAEAGDVPGLIAFSVRDTGIGIPESRMIKIFEAFEQVDGSTTRRYGGTGLGLAIAQRLVTLMGGRVWVESEVGQGSTFHFTIQFEPCDGASLSEDQDGEASLKGVRTLIVDDNETNRLILEEVTRTWGMESQSVDCAADALIALALEAPSDPFEIVLLDWMMPGMSGVDLAYRIRDDVAIPKPRLILLSSGGAPCELDALARSGIDACLLKPVKRSELLAAIRRVLGHPQANREGRDRALQKATNPAGPRLKILLAEDNPVNQTFAAELIRKRSHEVTVVNNGREALEALARNTFDLVLMDVQMPELDGLSAAAAIRESERGGTTHLPIVALTAFAMKGDRERCLEAGCDGYVTKPVRSDLLFATIENVLHPDRIQSTGESPPVASSPLVDVATPFLAPVPAVNWPRFSRAVDGDLELATRMIELFLEDCPGLEAEVCASVREGDPIRLRASAHALKGSASNFAADRVVKITERLEHMGGAGELLAAAELLEPLGTALKALREALSDPPAEVAYRPNLDDALRFEPTRGWDDR
ncbi:MAG: response regulator [Isosphaeraceae bacterium]